MAEMKGDIVPGCKGCQKINHCKTRAQEWLLNIDRILFPPDGRLKRSPGEGQLMAEEVIHLMQEEFVPEECERKK